MGVRTRERERERERDREVVPNVKRVFNDKTM